LIFGGGAPDARFDTEGIAAFAMAAAIPASSAADLAARPYTKAPPVMVEVWNWTGFYIGGNAGYSWGRSNTDVSFFNTVTGVPIALPPGVRSPATASM
jgi:outer membrane immunogenic protein